MKRSWSVIMRSKPAKNDTAWEKLFSEYSIASRVAASGSFRISADQIRKYREPRLMTKFDHSSNLPRPFSENSLSILPVSRGDYLIAPMNLYKKLDSAASQAGIICTESPRGLQSLDISSITSESAAINAAFAAGILDDFIGEPLIPTVSGRMSSGKFSFEVENRLTSSFDNVQVCNSQLEIDGGYEGPSSLCLIEAKNAICDDFLIRQLYYPYRLWRTKVEKRVRPVFMIYSNGIFHLFEYKFIIESRINSLRLIQYKRYTLDHPSISMDELRILPAETAIGPEPGVPFPQANSFERVINLCELLSENELSEDDITSVYDFTDRQSGYYANAGRYLGLIEFQSRGDGLRRLTDKGRELFTMDMRGRQLGLAVLILSHAVFSDCLNLYFEEGEFPSREIVAGLMENRGVYGITGRSTFLRRADTVIAWCRWIISLGNEESRIQAGDLQPELDIQD